MGQSRAFTPREILLPRSWGAPIPVRGPALVTPWSSGSSQPGMLPAASVRIDPTGGPHRCDGLTRATTCRPLTGAMTTVAEILRSRADSDAPALLVEDRRVTYRELIEEASRRAALFDELRDANRPPHVAVLLENVP